MWTSGGRRDGLGGQQRPLCGHHVDDRNCVEVIAGKPLCAGDLASRNCFVTEDEDQPGATPDLGSVGRPTGSGRVFGGSDRQRNALLPSDRRVGAARLFEAPPSHTWRGLVLILPSTERRACPDLRFLG